MATHPPPAHRYPVLLLVFAACLHGGGCSNRSLYNQVDWMARVYLERFVDLDRNQSARLQVNLESLLEWHRRDELTGYQDFLRDMEEDLQGPITAAQVANWGERVMQAYEQVRNKAIPVLISTAESLTAEQVDEFLASLEKRYAKSRKKYLKRDESEYRESLHEQFEERLEYWLGRLTPAQKQRIEETVDSYERSDEAWLQAQRDWQDQVAWELRREPGWQERLAVLIRNPGGLSGRDADAARLRNEQRIYQTIAEVINQRTEKQRQKLVAVLDKWHRNFSAIQAEPQTGSRTI